MDDSVQSVTAADRRRPGRREDVSPDLVSLLRGCRANVQRECESNTDIVPKASVLDTRGRQCRDLAPARGVFVGAVLGAVLWAALLWMAKTVF